MASTYLSRTLSASDTLKWTWSAWVKRHKTGAIHPLFHADNGGSSYYTHISFHDTDQLFFQNRYANSNQGYKITTAQFRDTNAWMHVQFVWDSANSTADDRQIIYVNGERLTEFGGANVAVPQNQVSRINDAYEHRIGRGDTGMNSGQYADYTLSHVHFCDGYAYGADSFGSTDNVTGQWKINTSPSVSYGTNGFFILKDGNSVTDQSGNSNNFTANGTLTNTFDCPSNNFATLNKLYRTPYASSFTNGNNTATTGGAGNYYPCFSSIGVSTGKFYAEFKPNAGDFHIGISSQDDCDNSFILNDRYIGETSKSVGIANSNGSYYIAGSATSYGSSYSDTHIIGVALDMTNKKLYVSKDGTFYNSANPSSGTGGIDISGILSSGDHAFFAFTNYRGSGTGSCHVNFGNGFFGTTAITTNSGNGYAGAEGKSKFNYQPPTGFSALTTRGLNE